MTKKLILCDCLGSQNVDAEGIARAAGLDCSKVHTALCLDQIEIAANAISSGEAIIACQQERQRFEALATEIEAEVPGFVDLRDRAGWGDGGASAMPKMAALAAEAVLPMPDAKTLDVVSEGTCLIIGDADVAVPAAERLSDALAVTILLSDLNEIQQDSRYDVVAGHLRKASGALGGFDLVIDAFQQVIPGGRGALSLPEARDGAKSACDVILDLTGGTPLFSAPEKREGYLRADPKSQSATATAVFEAAQLVGTFEKPLYVRLETALCAHSRAEQPACSNCLDLCPTGAITSVGDYVAVDPMICAGCGACSAVCPSGAISLDAPPVETVFRRLETLARTYRDAGGNAPRLLVHDRDFGAEMISLAARYGRGLPVDVIPLEIEALAGFGHSEMLAALAVGFAQVDILLNPSTERQALDTESAIAIVIAGKKSIRFLEPREPDDLSEDLYNQEVTTPDVAPVMPMGTRRQVARLAAKALQPEAEIVALPDDAPYGAVVVDTEACTLCLSCVSLCPSGALGDNPDLPQLRFQEDACLQCGLCHNICPEKAITLEPQLNLADTALSQAILYEEEPFACVECGALFGAKSTIEKITEKLAGKHSMFATSDAARLIQMCDNCRINAQYHSHDNPFQGGERPRVRTTDDYLSKRKDH
ncbi:MAG: 4Fe-4S binding protein [Boseongicola sp.]